MPFLISTPRNKWCHEFIPSWKSSLQIHLVIQIRVLVSNETNMCGYYGNRSQISLTWWVVDETILGSFNYPDLRFHLLNKAYVFIVLSSMYLKKSGLDNVIRKVQNNVIWPNRKTKYRGAEITKLILAKFVCQSCLICNTLLFCFSFWILYPQDQLWDC